MPGPQVMSNPDHAFPMNGGLFVVTWSAHGGAELYSRQRLSHSIYVHATPSCIHPVHPWICASGHWVWCRYQAGLALMGTVHWNASVGFWSHNQQAPAMTPHAMYAAHAALRPRLNGSLPSIPTYQKLLVHGPSRFLALNSWAVSSGDCDRASPAV